MHVPTHALLGLAYGLSEVGIGLRKRSRGDSVDADRRSLRRLWGTIVLSIAAAIVVSYLVPQTSFDGQAWPGMGYLLFGGGLALRWYSILHLGRFFTVNVAIHSGHVVIDTGPYRHVRHPSYTGALLAFLGLALTLTNWLSLALVVLPIFWAFSRRIAVEEAALASALGAPYTNYMGRTKRLAPFVY